MPSAARTYQAVAARRTLAPAEQVRFFGALGRRYGIISGLALLVFAATGMGLAGDPSAWTGTETAVAILTVLVAALTVAGVLNAAPVQRVRSQALADPVDAALGARLRSAARTAAALRVLIAAVTLAAVIVAAV